MYRINVLRDRQGNHPKFCLTETRKFGTICYRTSNSKRLFRGNAMSDYRVLHVFHPEMSHFIIIIIRQPVSVSLTRYTKGSRNVWYWS